VSAIGPSLFAAPTVVREIAEARAVTVLIGGYDGSGNYGDIAQLDAALALVERLGPGMLALPVLERQYLTTHRELVEDAGVNSPQALFFDPEGGHEDDLVPVAAPIELAFGACYLYGGGYLNPSWGARRLAMLEAAEALLEAGGVTPYRVASGLQVEAKWIAEKGADALSRFDYLGARDAGSRRTLEALDAKATTRETGDDAVGPLGQVPVPVQRPADDARLRLNLHFAEHDWASERPQALLDFYTGFVAELQRLAEQPLLAQPLIAYLDPRVDERPGVERLRHACAERGIEIAEPLILRPAGLAEAAPLLRAASLTLSCSYHVALTSLMLEVPAVLVADNPYYEQKAAGLRDGFALPPAFTVAATDDPTARAGEIAAKLFDPDDGELRRGVATGAERLRQRRARTEIELLGRLGAAATAGLGSRLEEQAERLRQRSTEPAELRVRLAALQTELEEAERPAGPAPTAVKPRAPEVEGPVGAPLLEAELRAQEAEAALDTILRSRSWRLLAPLRRLGAHLRERWRNVRRPL
jgi:polysaccharide pyruvyl transferase WcaK-like protein